MENTNTNLKLSDFLINKRAKFIENEQGEIVLEEVDSIKNILVGKEITWYTMSKEKLKDIRDNVLKENMTDEEFMFNVIPYICNIDVDVTFSQFKQLTSIPTKEFNYILKGLVDYVNVLFESGVQALDLKDKLKETEQKTTDTKEQLKVELYKTLNSTNDSEERKKLIKQLAELENL